MENNVYYNDPMTLATLAKLRARRESPTGQAIAELEAAIIQRGGGMGEPPRYRGEGLDWQQAGWLAQRKFDLLKQYATPEEAARLAQLRSEQTSQDAQAA